MALISVGRYKIKRVVNNVKDKESYQLFEDEEALTQPICLSDALELMLSSWCEKNSKHICEAEDHEEIKITLTIK